MKDIKFLYILLFAILIPSVCLADWIKIVTTDSGDVHYLNIDSLKRTGPRTVSLWTRIELKKPTYGKETKSIRVLLEHDCLLNKQRVLRTIEFTGQNFTGTSEISLENGKWFDIETNTIGQMIHSSICKY